MIAPTIFIKMFIATTLILYTARLTLHRARLALLAIYVSPAHHFLQLLRILKSQPDGHLFLFPIIFISMAFSKKSGF